MLLASTLSGLSINPADPLPVVTLADQAGGTRLVAQGSATGAGIDGLTDFATGHVWLYRGWSGTPRDLCLLTHEMTHVLQLRHRWPPTCRAMEPLAYLVQQRCSVMIGDRAMADYLAAHVNDPVCVPGAQ